MAVDWIQRKTLLVVDDHEVVADGIASVLGDAYIVLKAADVAQALEVDALHPEIDGYVVDLSIGTPTDGLVLIGKLRERGRRKPVMVFTMHGGPWNVALLRKTDVEGIVLKDDGVAEFRRAVGTVMAGGRYRSPEFDACCRELDRADNPVLEWSSDNESVATVSQDGVVYVNAPGEAVITAAATDGSLVKSQALITGISGVDELFDSDTVWSLYDIDGRLLRGELSRGDMELLQPGVYILRNASRVIKIHIRH